MHAPGAWTAHHAQLHHPAGLVDVGRGPLEAHERAVAHHALLQPGPRIQQRVADPQGRGRRGARRPLAGPQRHHHRVRRDGTRGGPAARRARPAGAARRGARQRPGQIRHRGPLLGAHQDVRALPRRRTRPGHTDQQLHDEPPLRPTTTNPQAPARREILHERGRARIDVAQVVGPGRVQQGAHALGEPLVAAHRRQAQVRLP